MVDLNALSNEELEAIVAGSHPLVAQLPSQNSSSPDLNALSNEELEAIVNGTSTRTKDWNIIDSAKNLGSGVVEGLTGMVGLAADLNPFQSPAQRFANQLIAKSEGGSGMFPASEIITKEIEPYLAEKDPQYRYARTTGNIAAPIPIKGANTLKSLVTSIFGGLGAQAAEDATGDTKVAPVVGAVTASGAASAADDIMSLLRRVFVGASDKEIAGSAAKVLQESTGLNADDIKAVIPDQADPFNTVKTLAEVSENAGAAQLEKTLATDRNNAILYNEKKLARENLRNEKLDSLSSVAGANKEGLGTTLIQKAESVKEAGDKAANKIWEAFPRNIPVNIIPEQFQLERVITAKQGGLPTGSKVQELVDQLMNTEGVLTSGALQDIRSDAARLLRDAPNLSGHEERLLSYIVGNDSGVDRAFSRELSGKPKAIWDRARTVTAVNAETFGRNAAGGSLIREDARASNVLSNAVKGDSKSIRQLKQAIDNDPAVIEQVKRGVLDMIPRDAQEQLTPAGLRKFIQANEGSLLELYGEEGTNTIKKIADDLKSEAKVQKQAFRASEGNSVTSQRETVAGVIDQLLSESVVPGGQGWIATLASKLKEGASLNDKARVREKLFEAILDPNSAFELAQTPTEKRLMSALDWLNDSATNVAKSSAASGVKELSRTQSDKSSNTRQLVVDAFGQNDSQKHIDERQGESQNSVKNQAYNTQGNSSDDQNDNQAKQPNNNVQDGVANGVNHTSNNTPLSSLLKTVFSPSKGIVADMFGSGEMARSPEFDKRAIEVADNLGIDPEHLFKVIGFETGGTFDSKVKNAAGSGATGLLQFMPPTAKDLTEADTEKAAIRLLESLTPTEQLDYVEKYLRPFKGKIKSLEDLYMAVLWPAAIGKDSSYALFRKGTKAFAQNKGLDINDDGIITKAEAASKVRSYEV